MTSNFLNKVIDWIDLFSKNYEIDFYDPMLSLNYHIKEIHYDKEQIILFMEHMGSWDDDFYVLNISEIKNIGVERNNLFCYIVKNGIQLRLIFTKSVVIHQHDPNYENKILKIREQKDCYDLDSNSLTEILKKFKEVKVPKIKKIIGYYSLKYPQLSTEYLISTLIEN